MMSDSFHQALSALCSSYLYCECKYEQRIVICRERAKAERVRSERDASVSNDRHRDKDRLRDSRRDHADFYNAELGKCPPIQLSSCMHYT